MGGRLLTDMADALGRMSKKYGVEPHDIEEAMLVRAETDKTGRDKIVSELLGIPVDQAQRMYQDYKKFELVISRKTGERPAKEPPMPPIPAEFQESMSVISTVEKLKTRRNAIEGQIDELKHQQELIDQEIKTYAPVLHAAQLLTKSIQQMRADVRAKSVN